LHAWNIELTIKHGAVLVSPNYRFLPESTGVEILSDVDDFWTWLHSSETKELLSKHSVELDLDRIITSGESAGGLLSLYLALSRPGQVRAATAAYPMINHDEPALFPQVPNPHMPTLPESVAFQWLKVMKPGEVVSSAPPPERSEFGSAILRNGKLNDYYLRDADKSPWHRRFLSLLHRLDHPDQKLPRGGISIIHGIDDDIVPPEASVRFVTKARAVFNGRGGEKVLVTLQPGGHGFDTAARLEDQWLDDSLTFVVQTWLE
jgi:acetyl esterase/lipase